MRYVCCIVWQLGLNVSYRACVICIVKAFRTYTIVRTKLSETVIVSLFRQKLTMIAAPLTSLPSVMEIMMDPMPLYKETMFHPAVPSKSLDLSKYIRPGSRTCGAVMYYFTDFKLSHDVTGCGLSEKSQSFAKDVFGLGKLIKDDLLDVSLSEY